MRAGVLQVVQICLCILAVAAAAGCVSGVPDTDDGGPVPSYASDMKGTDGSSKEERGGMVEVLSDPPFAAVLVDGEYAGVSTPAVIPVSWGNHTIGAESSYGRVSSAQVTVAGNTTVELRISPEQGTGRFLDAETLQVSVAGGNVPPHGSRPGKVFGSPLTPGVFIPPEFDVFLFPCCHRVKGGMNDAGCAEPVPGVRIKSGMTEFISGSDNRIGIAVTFPGTENDGCRCRLTGTAGRTVFTPITTGLRTTVIMTIPLPMTIATYITSVTCRTLSCRCRNSKQADGQCKSKQYRL